MIRHRGLSNLGKLPPDLRAGGVVDSVQFSLVGNWALASRRLFEPEGCEVDVNFTRCAAQPTIRFRASRSILETTESLVEGIAFVVICRIGYVRIQMNHKTAVGQFVYGAPTIRFDILIQGVAPVIAIR